MNLQNIPRDNLSVKRCFVPKLDMFLFADYSQIELRLLAFYLHHAGHSDMAEAMSNEVDLHTESAEALFGSGVSDKQRQIGKMLNFSIVYGGGVGTVMKQLKITAPEAFDLLRKFHGRWPGIGWGTRKRPAPPGTLIHQLDSKIAERGYIKTLWGRRLNPASPHKRLNALIQGCAADLMRSSILNVSRYLNENNMQSHLVNCIHDELMLDVCKEEFETILSQLPRLMDNPTISSVVPIKVSFEYSDTNWAESRPVEEYHV